MTWASFLISLSSHELDTQHIRASPTKPPQLKGEGNQSPPSASTLQLLPLCPFNVISVVKALEGSDGEKGADDRAVSEILQKLSLHEGEGCPKIQNPAPAIKNIPALLCPLDSCLGRKPDSVYSSVFLHNFVLYRAMVSSAWGLLIPGSMLREHS